MRPAVNERIGQDKRKNQIIANINYDQNSMSVFKKHLITKIRMDSDKTWTKKFNLYFFR